MQSRKRRSRVSQQVSKFLADHRKALFCRMHLVCPMLLIGPVVLKRVAKIQIVDMSKARGGTYVLQHRVELIDELDDHGGVLAEINVALLPKSGLQPRAGQRPESAPEAPAIGKCVVVAVCHDGNRST